MFAQGLPKSLADSCIDIDSPENFEQWANTAQPRLPPCDPNAMDTSMVACKATTKVEKEKHWKEGHCFECSKQGHLT
jgi:hypothetical protein